jgi:outer membrane protein OmpA-like peptidoglycan-associated protein
MNRPHSLPFLIAILAGCAASPTSERHAAIYAILDPATGIAYNVPLRYDLRGGLDSMPLPGATRRSASALDKYVFGPRENTDTRRNTGATVVEGPVRAELTESSRAHRAERRVDEGAPPPRFVTQSLNLKLDTEFESAKRLIRFAVGAATLGPIGRLAIAELVPWAKQAEKVHVRGGADLSGNAARNRELAIARATAVSSAFVAAGVDREKISKSSCVDCYVVSNDTAQNRRLNRRVDVELVLKKELAAQLPPPVHALKAPDSTPLIHATALR